jgi:hypothetical protein
MNLLHWFKFRLLKKLDLTYCCDKLFGWSYGGYNLKTKSVFWNKLTQQFMCSKCSNSLEWNS